MKYNSGGEFVTVETYTGDKFEEVIVCLDPKDSNVVLLESSNGDVARMLKGNLKTFY